MLGYYHLSVKMIGRSNGRSAVACAAYRSGQKLADERYGTVHDYGPRKGVFFATVVAPDGSPEWATDRERLWNAVERAERRKDAQLAREMTLGLPAQLGEDERLALVERFAQEQLVSRGLVVDYAIHAPSRQGDQRNWHAHLMTTLRPVGQEGFSSHKDREGCSKETLRAWREAWAALQNEALDRAGVTDGRGRALRVDHRSYADQGLDLEPTQHMGVHATSMERRGKATEIGEGNRAVARMNQARQLLRRRASGARHDLLGGEAGPEQRDARANDDSPSP